MFLISVEVGMEMEMEGVLLSLLAEVERGVEFEGIGMVVVESLE